jgi:hypothetical protein
MSKYVSLGLIALALALFFAMGERLEAQQPEITVERYPFAGYLVTGNTLTFTAGSPPGGSATSILGIRIRNTGGATLSGISLSKSGPDAGNFSWYTTMGSSILSGGDGVISLYFTPTTSGSKSATFTIASNDADEANFTLQLSGTAYLPEIAIGSPTDGSEVTANSTVSLGNANVGVGTGYGFGIWNSGLATLSCGGVMVSGTHAADFSIFTQPSSTVNAGMGSGFVLQFFPKAPGTRTAKLTVYSSDPDEGSVTFDITGFGLAPLISIRKPDGTEVGPELDFGIVPPGGTSAITLTIANVGDAPLTGLVLTKDGQSPSEFNVPTPPTGPVPVGGSVDFLVRFQPSGSARREAFLRFATNAWNNPSTSTMVSGVHQISLADWRVQQFQGAVNTPAAASSGDFDHDGIPNLVEYALGSSPTEESAAPVMTMAPVEAGETDYWEVKVKKAPEARGIVFTPWVYDAGTGTWKTGPGNVTLEEASSTLLEYRDAVPYGSVGTRFFRLEVAEE